MTSEQDGEKIWLGLGKPTQIWPESFIRNGRYLLPFPSLTAGQMFEPRGEMIGYLAYKSVVSFVSRAVPQTLGTYSTTSKMLQGTDEVNLN